MKPEKKALRLLIIEDSDDDTVLICEELKRGGYSPVSQRVQNAEELKRALARGGLDAIVSDYSLPQFNALEALRIVQSSGADIPFVVVSGSVREATIVETMRAGARDYVMKQNLTRLPLAIDRELDEARERRERRQFEEQLQHTQRLESLGVLAGGIAHDFNNLLTTIIGNVSLALDDAPGSLPVRPMLERALHASEQAANLTRQLLAYAGKGRFSAQPLDVSAAVRDIGALISVSIPKNVDLIFRLEDRLPMVEADRGQIQQVLMNLVMNAAEAIGSDRPGTVLVTTGRHDLTENELRNVIVRDDLEPGAYVCVEVRDTGSGIDSATMRRIFDPFFTTRFTGRGLGLSAVMGIVRGHKGGIQVRSEPGKGSLFAVFLPPSNGDRIGLMPAGSEASDGVVLVIDDEEGIRRTAKAILETRGFSVFLADTGHAGIDAFRRLSDRIALILLDLTMPDLSGNDVLREVREIRPDVPVVLSSGYSQDEARRRIGGAEIADFLQKPWTAPQLVETVRTALEESPLSNAKGSHQDQAGNFAR